MKDKEGVSPEPHKEDDPWVDKYNDYSEDFAVKPVYTSEKTLYICPVGCSRDALQSRIAELDKSLTYCHGRMNEAYSEIRSLESRLRKANDYLEAQGMNVKF